MFPAASLHVTLGKWLRTLFSSREQSLLRTLVPGALGVPAPKDGAVISVGLAFTPSQADLFSPGCVPRSSLPWGAITLDPGEEKGAENQIIKELFSSFFQTVGYSKNQAIAQSSGSYLCFLDSVSNIVLFKVCVCVVVE